MASHTCDSNSSTAYFPPENESGVIPPTSRNNLDEYAVEELFSDYFLRSGYASLREDRAELVSQIFEHRTDNLEKVNEIEQKLGDLYPESDILRTQTDPPDREGPEWEYHIDILIVVANLGTDSPQVRWKYGHENGLFGKQLTPPGAVANGHIALTDGRELCGVRTETGDPAWSIELPNRTHRSPTLVDQTVVMEAQEHIAYDIESGEYLWTVDDLPVGATTRHVTLDKNCYFGDSNGTVWELSSSGEYQVICELEERIIELHPTSEHVYVLMRGEGASGLRPETLHAVDRDSGDVNWVYSPEQGLNSEVIAGPDHVYISTRERIIALHSASGDIAWMKPAEESSADGEMDGNAEEDGEAENLDWRDIDPDEWEQSVTPSRSGVSSQLNRPERMQFTAKPVFDEDLFAPTNQGLIRIDPGTGEVIWKSLNHDGRRIRSFSPPTHDGDHLYVGADADVYAINKTDGEIAREFETPGQPGTMTYCPDTESLTFISEGLGINVGSNRGE